jgi:hypothetical protein
MKGRFVSYFVTISKLRLHGSLNAVPKPLFYEAFRRCTNSKVDYSYSRLMKVLHRFQKLCGKNFLRWMETHNFAMRSSSRCMVMKANPCPLPLRWLKAMQSSRDDCSRKRTSTRMIPSGNGSLDEIIEGESKRVVLMIAPYCNSQSIV